MPMLIAFIPLAETWRQATRQGSKLAKKARRLAAERGHRSGTKYAASTVSPAKVSEREQASEIGARIESSVPAPCRNRRGKQA